MNPRTARKKEYKKRLAVLQQEYLDKSHKLKYDYLNSWKDDNTILYETYIRSICHRITWNNIKRCGLFTLLYKRLYNECLYWYSRYTHKSFVYNRKHGYKADFCHINPVSIVIDSGSNTGPDHNKDVQEILKSNIEKFNEILENAKHS